MNEDLKFVIGELNKLFKKIYTIISFKSVQSADLLQVRNLLLFEGMENLWKLLLMENKFIYFVSDIEWRFSGCHWYPESWYERWEFGSIGGENIINFEGS